MVAAAEIGSNPVRKYQKADAGRDGQIRLVRLNSQAQTGTGKS